MKLAMAKATNLAAELILSINMSLCEGCCLWAFVSEEEGIEKSKERRNVEMSRYVRASFLKWAADCRAKERVSERARRVVKKNEKGRTYSYFILSCIFIAPCILRSNASKESFPLDFG